MENTGSRGLQARGKKAAESEGMSEGQRAGVRLLLSSTRFIASLFWLTIAVATLLFVLPYSQRTQSPVFYAFVVLSILVYLAHRFFPFEGYHPVAFFLLQTATDALIAVMVYLSGGKASGLSLLFLVVIIFSSAYFELLETMLITAVTCAFFFAPLSYEAFDVETLKGMAMAVPVYFLIALCGSFVINKSREQEREKQALSSLYDQADTKRRELSSLYAASLKFASTLDTEQLLEVLLDNAGKLVESDAMAVSLYREGKLRIMECRGMSRETAGILEEEGGGNPLALSASAVLPVSLAEKEDDPAFTEFLERIGFDSMIAVPLFASSSVIGVLCCFSTRRDAFDDDAARILLTLSSEAALALEKASLYLTTLEDKKKIEAIINSLTDGIMVLDREGRLVLANPFASRLLGIGEEDTGRELVEILQRQGGKVDFEGVTLRAAMEEVFEHAQSVKGEMSLMTEPPIIFQVLWVPLLDAARKATGAIVLLHDVTDFIELDRMKSDFISIVSHELKTPLTSIKGFVRLLSAGRVGPVNEKQLHYLEIVTQQTESLTELINDLLDLSRIESGVMEVRREPVRLREVIREVLQGLENMAREKGVVLGESVPDGMPAVSGDAYRIAQIFTNLIHNAVKFTPPGGEVRVEGEWDAERCRIRVRDTGMGIPAQDLERIFDKFYQVDSSSTRQQSGTGLGLCITRQLVAAHGGEIGVESELGKGSIFTVTLPVHTPVEGGAEGESGGEARLAAG
ncbi:MAG: GAF domain-containing protein [Actinobacteria bacterium]|nr:GAF domain-containing protein [Actinomycetota bacterium]